MIRDLCNVAVRDSDDCGERALGWQGLTNAYYQIEEANRGSGPEGALTQVVDFSISHMQLIWRDSRVLQKMSLLYIILYLLFELHALSMF